MRDRDIRTALKSQLAADRLPDDTWIFDEFGVAHGASRVDICLVNGLLEGIEIKSDRDTLRRLPAQVEAYNRVFDRVVIVASGSHVDRLTEIVPEWWGISRAEQGTAGIEIEELRSSDVNPHRDPVALAQLLWRDELIEALNKCGAAEGLRSKSKPVLQAALVNSVGLEALSDIVRDALKCRDWRSG